MRVVVSVSIAFMVLTSTACSGGESTGTSGSETDGASTAETEGQASGDASGSEAQDEVDASTSENLGPDGDEGTEVQHDGASSDDDIAAGGDDASEDPVTDATDEPSSMDAAISDSASEPVDDAAGPVKLDTSGSSSDVVAENQPPVANDDLAKAEADQPITIFVLGNDSDVDGDKLEITSVTQGVNGGLISIVDGIEMQDDTISYSQFNPSFVGTDSFTYTIDDGHGHEATATVIVTVVEPSPEPVLTIISPEHGEVVSGDTVSVEFEITGCNFVSPAVDAEGCHGHKFLDGDKYSVPGSVAYGHYSTLPFDIGPLTNGPNSQS